MNFRKNLIVVLLVFSIFISISMVSANEINGCDDVGNFTDLQASLNNANGTLDLTKDYNNTDNHDSIVINSDIVINGKGHTIDANGKSGIFNIASRVTVTFNDLTFINGIGTVKFDDNSGGAIYANNGCKLNVINCQFIKNTALYGGAIYGNKGSNIIILDSIFIDTIAKDGGAVFSYYYGNVTVINSIFNNTSASYSGGAISGLNGKLFVSDSTFINTTAYFDGAISGFDNVTVAYSLFQNITSPNEGSIIHSGRIVNLFYNEYNGKTKYNSTEVKGRVDNYIYRNDNVFLVDYSIFDSNVEMSYFWNVSCEDDFKQLSNYLKSCNVNYKYIYINITKDMKISGSNVLNIKSNTTFVIAGNGHTIKYSNPCDGKEIHFLTCGEQGNAIILNCTLFGFNSAIVNYGTVNIIKVKFEHSRLIPFKNWFCGGAIWNQGNLNCLNCSFIDNYARLGGAIFSEGVSSSAILTNCYFSDNVAYDVGYVMAHSFDDNSVCPGGDIFVGEGGTVYSYALNQPRLLHGPNEFFCTPNKYINIGHYNSNYGSTIVLRDSFEPVVREYVINNITNLHDVVNEINGAGTSVDNFVINLTGDINFTSWTDKLDLFKPAYGSLVINGNGHIINLKDATDRDEHHFATLNSRYCSLSVNNLTISGFNCAIINKGGAACFENVTFFNNRIKYIMDSGDDAGAISNCGLLTCKNCTFINNFGLWAGAIYGAHGGQSYINNCTFINNGHSKDDGSDLHSYNNAKFFINGIEVNRTGNYYLNGTNVSVSYQQPPSGFVKVLYTCLDFITPFVSAFVGLTAGFLTTVFTGNPLAGIIVGTAVGFSVGIGLNMAYKLYYAGLTHKFSYNIFWDMIIQIPGHLMAAYGGATIGAKLGVHVYEINVENKRMEIREMNSRIENVGKLINKIGTSNENFGKYHYFVDVEYADGTKIRYSGIYDRCMDAIDSILEYSYKKGVVNDWSWSDSWVCRYAEAELPFNYKIRGGVAHDLAGSY